MASDSQQTGIEGDVTKDQVEQQKVTIEESQISDNDGSERPVRRKLKETSITSVPSSANPANTSTQESQEESNRASSRGRKRSFNEDETEIIEDEAAHRRKRSRSSNLENENSISENVEETETEPVAKDPSNIMSPKKKRSRDQLDKDENKTEAADKEIKDSAEKVASAGKSAAGGEPEKKRHRDDSQERDSAALPSAFANTSAVSPFGSLAAKPNAKEEDTSKKTHVTSSSAFAASSLAAFSGSEQSPFGSLGGSTESVFKKAPATAETEKPKTGFAAPEGPSPFATKAVSGFASAGSGFSGFGGGYGAAAKTGGLTSFASPGPSSLSSTSQAKAFGAPEEENEEEQEEEANDGPGEFEQEKTDERFFEREIETGEEEEKTYFSCKAKLFQFSDKEWRERGHGTFKVNVKVTNDKEDRNAARMIMRADGVGRVIMNTPLFKGMTVGDASGKEPKTKHINLASLETGRSMPILLRTASDDSSKELYHVVCDLLKDQ